MSREGRSASELPYMSLAPATRDACNCQKDYSKQTDLVYDLLSLLLLLVLCENVSSTAPMARGIGWDNSMTSLRNIPYNDVPGPITCGHRMPNLKD